MRELTLQELELIAGGSSTAVTNAVDVVVTADPGDDDGGFFPPTLDDFGGGDWGYGDNGGDGGYDGGLGGDGPGTGYPPTFDQAIDDQADALAAAIAAQIGNLPDIDKVEYGAVIWKDSAGNLHTTSIKSGDTNHFQAAQVWGEIDFAHGAQVVSVIHSHPTFYNAGSVENPNWQPATQSGYLSSGDFDNLMARGSGTEAGFDAANYRTYLVHGGAVTEYYAFDQDPTQIRRGGQATWAVPSTDYGQ